MGTIIDFQSRRALRRAGAADPLSRIDSAIGELASRIRGLDDRSKEADELIRSLHEIREAVEQRRLNEAAAQAEDLLLRMASSNVG